MDLWIDIHVGSVFCLWKYMYSGSRLEHVYVKQMLCANTRYLIGQCAISKLQINNLRFQPHSISVVLKETSVCSKFRFVSIGFKSKFMQLYNYEIWTSCQNILVTLQLLLLQLTTTVSLRIMSEILMPTFSYYYE